MRLPATVDKAEIILIIMHKIFCADHTLVEDASDLISSEKLAKDLDNPDIIAERKTRLKQLETFTQDTKRILNLLKLDHDLTSKDYSLIELIIQEEIYIQNNILKLIRKRIETADKVRSEYCGTFLLKSYKRVKKRSDNLQELLMKINSDLVPIVYGVRK